MAIGALGPWVTFLGFSVSGTEGDGWIVFGGALVAGSLIVWHDRNPRLWKLVVATLAAVAAFGTAAYDWSEVESIAADAEEVEGFFNLSVSVGWGLVLCTFASASLIAALLGHYLRHRAASFTHASGPSAEIAESNTAVAAEPPRADT
jgi:hypothetical protein